MPELKNLKPHPRRPGTLHYRDLPQGEVIEVQVYYDKGSCAATRGIVLDITPMTVEEGTTKFALCSGHSALVRPLSRAKPRELAAVAAAVDPKVVDLAATFRRDSDEGKKAFTALAAELRSM